LLDYILVNYNSYISLSNLQYYVHFLTHAPLIPQQVFKYLIVKHIKTTIRICVSKNNLNIVMSW